MKDLQNVKNINEVAYDFLVSFNPDKYIDGRLNLENGVYVNIESYETQNRVDRKFEAHRKYIDIQYMIDGEELITVCPVSDLIVEEDYNSEKDIEFFKNGLKGMDYSLSSGEYLIIFPDEGHMPCIALNGKKRVRKAVIKVPTD